MRGTNNLVCIGTVANRAAHLTALIFDDTTWITKRVYDGEREGQMIGTEGENLWRVLKWSQRNNEDIYSSAYWRIFT